jgi:hypothetical protein
MVSLCLSLFSPGHQRAEVIAWPKHVLDLFWREDLGTVLQNLRHSLEQRQLFLDLGLCHGWLYSEQIVCHLCLDCSQILKLVADLKALSV